MTVYAWPAFEKIIRYLKNMEIDLSSSVCSSGTSHCNDTYSWEENV